MKTGKVPESVLKRSILRQIHTKRKEVLVGAAVGEDCAAIQLEEDEVFVLSTDPITGTAEDIGSLAIQVTLNDLASAGAEPVGILLTVLLPEAITEPEIRQSLEGRGLRVCLVLSRSLSMQSPAEQSKRLTMAIFSTLSRTSSGGIEDFQ